MFKFITGMVVGVILTFIISAITDESTDDLEYDPDFDEDIYGLDMKVTFVEKIRDEIRFDSMEALRMQLEKDRELWKQSSVY